MRLWELVVQIYALLSLPVEAVKSRSTDMAKMDVRSDPKAESLVRASRSITAPDDLENTHDTSTELEPSNPEDLLRSLRARDSFIRFGRGKDDNFMRFGRGKQDNFMRFGRPTEIETEPDKATDKYERFIRSGKGNKKSVNEKFERLTKNFIRLGRGKPDNFIRFGRGKQDNFMRFGRGKQDNFMRFGRGKQDNFMRFGRGKQDNFMRFGRGKQDNFMRFGRGKQNNFMRFGRGKEGNYMRFGRDMENFDLLSGKDKVDVNDLLHDTMAKPDRFSSQLIVSSRDNMLIPMHSSSDYYKNIDHFGKYDADQQTSQALTFSESLKNSPPFNIDSTSPLRETFTRVMKSKATDDVNLLRQGRYPPNKDDSFIRFGRGSLSSLGPNITPQRIKRSTFELNEDQDYELPSKVNEEISDRILLPAFSLTDYRGEDSSSSEQLKGYNNRRKRSVKFKQSPTSPIAERISSLDDVSSKLLVDSKYPDIFVMPLFLNPTSSHFSSVE